MQLYHNGEKWQWQHAEPLSTHCTHSHQCKIAYIFSLDNLPLVYNSGYSDLTASGYGSCISSRASLGKGLTLGLVRMPFAFLEPHVLCYSPF